ncbi:MAG TPA: DUF2489 domain-containing protein [Pseudomonadales bacterium]|nr:DUF2489 domain-containing protein [Pseudomonadales bacterium]
MTSTQILIALGALVIVGLGTYLAWLLLRIRAQRAEAERVGAELAQRNQGLHEERVQSIEMICIATLAGDCELSEACIRIRHLLLNYPGLATDDRFQVIGEMFEEISGFATHEARAALAPRERAAEDRARAAIEERYRVEMLSTLGTLRTAMTRLHGSAFDIDVALHASGARQSENAA